MQALIHGSKPKAIQGESIIQLNAMQASKVRSGRAGTVVGLDKIGRPLTAQGRRYALVGPPWAVSPTEAELKLVDVTELTPDL